MNKTNNLMIYICIIVVVLVIMFLVLLSIPGISVMRTPADVHLAENENFGRSYELLVEAIIIKPIGLNGFPQLIAKNEDYSIEQCLQNRVISYIHKGTMIKVSCIHKVVSLSWWYGLTNNIEVLGVISEGNDTNVFVDISSLFYFSGSKIHPCNLLLAN